ncbi:MAG: CPBP family intramembrane glutamic endopeptidase [Candidatus Limnocylindrales bacterium]
MPGTTAPAALAAGTLFGLALLAVALVTGWRPARLRAMSVALGLGAGLGLVVLPGLAHGLPAPGLGVHPQPFLLWAGVTVLVGTAEEVVLRGALFDATRDLAGLPVAVTVTSVLFALLHVPLYGWHVVPLDLAVGLVLAGLRLIDRGVAAPAIAHVVADLATWWS